MRPYASKSMRVESEFARDSIGATAALWGGCCFDETGEKMDENASRHQLFNASKNTTNSRVFSERNRIGALPRTNRKDSGKAGDSAGKASKTGYHRAEDPAE